MKLKILVVLTFLLFLCTATDLAGQKNHRKIMIQGTVVDIAGNPVHIKQAGDVSGYLKAKKSLSNESEIP